jgi:long-subunit fatty acid transport protein
MLSPRRLVGAALALAAAWSLVPLPDARAGGFTIPLIGGRASTKFAFVAKPDDTSAAYHNPAGLSLLGPYQIDISGTGILSYSAYRRCSIASPIGCATDASGNIRYEPTVETTKYGSLPRGFGILPYMGLSGRFGLKRWNFGLAVYSPHNATGSFPDCKRDAHGAPTDCSGAPQRFHAMLGTINTIYINPTASFEPHPAIAIGLGVSAVRAAITLDRSLWAGGDNGGAALFGWDGEGRVRLDANTWSWAFNLGVIWHVGKTFTKVRALRGLRLGLSYSSQTKFEFKDKMSLFQPAIWSAIVENDGCARAPDSTANDAHVQCKARADFRFPMLVRFGLNWEISKEWDIGFDVFWQQYSVYKEIRIDFPEPLELVTGTTVNGTSEPKSSTDSWSLALGVQYAPRWAKGLEMRSGVIFDQSPYPNSTYTLLSPDADKVGWSLGVSYVFKFGLEIGGGYIMLRYFDRIVRDSKIVPKICEEGDTDCLQTYPNAPFSMNGDVKNKIVHLFAMHVGWRFGGGKPALDAPQAAPPPPVGEPPAGDPRATPARTRPAPPPPPPPRAAPPRRDAPATPRTLPPRRKAAPTKAPAPVPPASPHTP